MLRCRGPTLILLAVGSALLLAKNPAHARWVGDPLPPGVAGWTNSDGSSGETLGECDGDWAAQPLPPSGALGVGGGVSNFVGDPSALVPRHAGLEPAANTWTLGTCRQDEDCHDGNPCTDNFCDPASGNCVSVLLPLSTPCELDGNICTVDHCDGNGHCVYLEEVSCDDYNPCTEDHCLPEGYCYNPPWPLSTPCEVDGDPCTIDHCDGNGSCVFLADVVCDDGNPCTEDYCDSANAICVYVPLPLSTPCELDGNVCTIDHCDGSSSCVFLEDVHCDDGNPCTEEGCDPAVGCWYLNRPWSTPCDVDGDFCTVDHCDGLGACVLLWFDDCDDGNPCTDDSCDPYAGMCLHVPSLLSTPCEADGSACTIDHCDGNGVCVFLQVSPVESHQKISDTEGSFTGLLSDWDVFGNALAWLGDFDGDGSGDLLVGARGDDGAGWERGAVWVLLLNGDGTVKSQHRISDNGGGFAGALDDEDYFGISVASLGDLDGDAVGDIAVGAFRDDDGGLNRGAVWVLFLNADATVKGHRKISGTAGNFSGALDDGDAFGISVATLGDLDGDGTTDLAVGAALDDDGGANRGAIWLLFLNPDGTVKSHQKISSTVGGFGGALDDGDQLSAVTSVGDCDGDGTTDLAVGAGLDDDGGVNRGAIWLLFLNPGGTVKSHQKISSTEGGFSGPLHDDDYFGSSLASLGDFSGDGTVDIVVGAHADDDGGYNRGAVWMLFLNSDGTVHSHRKISGTAGGFTGTLKDEDYFGVSLASLGDLESDGTVDISVGAHWDDDGGQNRGSVWVLSLCRLCDDQNVCTADEAIPNDGCIHPPYPDDTPCNDDGNVCTLDHCDGNGTCVLLSVDDCDDADACTIDTCDADAGCVHRSTDMTGSGGVDAADLALLLGSWGPNPGHPADFNEDGLVNAADLALLLGSWGPCP